MKASRFLAALLVLTLLLVMTTLGAFAAGKYSRFNNPGKGHDWSYSNSNDNSNTQHNFEHGYQNHGPVLQ